MGLYQLPGEGKKPQVPPLRCAPVGMTILLWELALAPVNGTSSRWHNKIVIPTGAQRSGGTCGFFPSPGSVVADKAKTAAPRKLIWTGVAANGRYELFKTTAHFDGAVANPKRLC